MEALMICNYAILTAVPKGWELSVYRHPVGQRTLLDVPTNDLAAAKLRAATVLGFHPAWQDRLPNAGAVAYGWKRADEITFVADLP
jgi:hypothetical protein